MTTGPRTHASIPPRVVSTCGETLADLIRLLNPPNELSIELLDRSQHKMVNEQTASVWRDVAETRAIYASSQVEIAFQSSLPQANSRKDPLLAPEPHLCLNR